MADNVKAAAACPNYPFSLEGFIVKDRKEDPIEHRVLYILQPTNEIPRECPDCGGKLHVHKKSTLKVRDLEEYGKEVSLLIEDKSYRCISCGKVYKASYSSITNQLTTRLADAIVRDSYREDTFTDVAKRYHVSVSRVQTAFEKHGDELMKGHHLIMPEVLGIDAVHLNNAYYGIFVKVDENDGGIIEVSEERTKAAVKETLLKLEQQERLQRVTMDMWQPFRDAVLDVFPEIPIIVDRFHVVKELIRCFDLIRAEACKKNMKPRVRASLRRSRYLLLADHDRLTPKNIERLKELLEQYPQFVLPYDLKESFRSIYDLAKTREEAMDMFDDWCDECKKSGVTAYDSFIGTVGNWKTEVFAYFDYKELDRTSTQAESLNRTIRDVARNGRGYSFQNLRLKMLFGTETTRSSRFAFASFFHEDI